MSDFLPFSRPSMGEAEFAALKEVLQSGWITTGPKNQALEEAFCALTGNRFSIAVSSATGGMHVTLMALGIGPGDEVITPSQTWVSTLNMIVLLGATPVMSDYPAYQSHYSRALCRCACGYRRYSRGC